MNRLTLAASLALLTSPGFTALASVDPPTGSRPRQTLAVREGAGQAESIDDLRRTGPTALSRLLDQYDRTRDASLIPTIDAVAAQKDALWSRLYWHTDLDAARSVAAAEHKPILYLRLLGKLTDEYSCANSRFFRTVLYADPRVSALLRERFVLVWQSERPVPVVTIDFGDGRVLKRTVTGNSAHFILTPDGEVVDAVPGLVDADTFKSILTTAADAAAGTPDDRRAHLLRSIGAAEAELAAARAELLHAAHAPASTDSDPFNAIVAGKTAPTKREVEAPITGSFRAAGVASQEKVNARKAMPLATGKTLVESPLVLELVQPQPAHIPAPEAAAATTGKFRVERPLLSTVAAAPPAPTTGDVPWAAIAALRLDSTPISDQSIALMRSQNPALDADPLLLDRTLVNFRRSLAEDTARNTLDFRPRILRWMTESPAPISLEELNRRVYAELFLTPRSDPWLGLVPDATYSALGNDGCGMTK